MPSILVFGSTHAARNNLISKKLENLNLEESENNPDLFIVGPEEGKKSIGIKQIRGVIKFFTEKPLNHVNKAVVIDRGELLTIPAQNALLKTLEEPPEFATIILNTKTENSLLATIVSRCKKIECREKEDIVFEGTSIKEILSLNEGQRLNWCIEFAKKERVEIIQTLEYWVGELREDLTLINSKNIQLINHVKSDLDNTNVSAKIAIEFLLLNLKS